jgi:hypothetical protein
MKRIAFILLLIFPAIVLGQKFAVIGDYRGGDTNAFKVSQLVKSKLPEFIVTTGDNFLYTQGTIDYQIGQFYQGFIFPYTGVYGLGDTVNRFFPALGNHDIEGTGLTDYLNYFTLPGNERYYDFVKGDIHFFMLNSDYTEPDGNTDTSVQAIWLQNSLAASGSKYNLVFLHHSPYSSGLHGCSLTSQWPFRQWGATAVFSGHDHDYERLYIDSLLYFVCAAGGAPLYTTFNNYPGSEHFYAANFGAMIIEATTDSMNLCYYNIKDSLIECVTIKSPSSGIKPLNNTTFDANSILQSYPNPHSSIATIKYFVNTESRVNLTLYSSSGLKIKTLVDEKQNRGLHEIELNTSGMSAGIYCICLKYGNKSYLTYTVKSDR